MKDLDTNILFRVDASFTIGLGHLVRCIALAQMLKEDFNITFFSREIPKIMVDELEEIGLNHLVIDNEISFINIISANNILVIDGYSFDTTYQQQLKATGAKLVCIDDLHDKEYVADLIINHTPGISPQDYRVQPYTQFALGLKYALLRPSFLVQAKKKRVIELVKTVMICFGGADIKNLTQSSLQVSLKFSQFKKIIVVTGAEFKITKQFKQLIDSDNRIDHRHALKEKNMLDTILETDLAIVPASGILFETISANCVVISGKYVDNQNFVYENFKNQRLFYDADNFEKEKLFCAISEVLRGNDRNIKSIDGDSSLRFSRLFKQLRKEFLCTLRPASITDLNLTYSWANNHEIRKFSFQKHKITEEEHRNWFLSKIIAINCQYLIFEYGKDPIGSIRFDIIGSEAIISYLLDPAYHSKGFGQIILKKGIEWLISVYIPNGRPLKLIRGDVMKTNLPSIKIFERFGFIKKEQVEKISFEKWI